MPFPFGRGPYQFADAARLIAPDKSDVAWLSYGLLFWVWPQVRWPVRRSAEDELGLGMYAALARTRRSRADVVRSLSETLPKAIANVDKILRDPVFQNFISDPALGANFHPVNIAACLTALFEVDRRARAAALSSELIAENGTTRPGRNKALSPVQVDEKVACAATVAVAWKMVRGTTLGPQTTDAAEAAEILFALGSAPAGHYEQVEQRTHWGTRLVSTWREHFEAASGRDRALARMSAMCENDLAFTRKWYRGDPDARAFPTMAAVNPPSNEPI